jgi:hypothetical protein
MNTHMNQNTCFSDIEESYVDTEDLAQELGIVPATVRYWARTYESFPVLKLPGTNRYRKSEVMNWLSSHERKKGRRTYVAIT